MILLQYKFAENEELAYAVTIESLRKILKNPDPRLINLEQRESFEIRIRQSLKSIDTDRNYLLGIVIEPIRHLRNGEEEALAATPQAFELVMSPFGQILWSSIPINMDQPPYPNHELNLGDEWTSEAKFATPFSQTPLVIPIFYQLETIEAVNGVTCAKVVVYSNEEIAQLPNQITQKTRVEGVNFFDYAKGCLIKSEIMVIIEGSSQDETIINTVKTSIELSTDTHISLTA